ncbi:GNAT family N-acetyltransferase [Actinosynnema sp. NPDC059335]|uniref:GNAT family N-acetyltransferase n=1 Tax=Actinosynnema sp. NPDC059335 TaxID=3346804 RepID=UPI00366C7763
MILEPFDPWRADEADLAGYHRVMRDSLAVDEPGEPAPTFEDVVARLRNPFPGVGPAGFWVVRDGGRIVAYAYARFPEDENSHIAVATVVVHPESRRRGVATRALRALLPELRRRGRTVIEDWRLVEGAVSAEWARRLGFRTVRAVVSMSMEVADADRSRWPVGLPPGYRVVRWSNETPEEVVASYAAARSAIHDAPMGTTEFVNPQWTVERIRRSEAGFRDDGVEQRVVAAVHEATGEVVGLTEVVVLPRDPGTAHQGDTAVLAAHRGRGLGLGLKGVMAHWLVEDHPALERTRSFTHVDNEHMIRVNHRLGMVTERTELVVAHDIDALIATMG